MVNWNLYSEDIKSNLYIMFFLGNKLDTDKRKSNLIEANKQLIQITPMYISTILSKTCLDLVEGQIGKEFINSIIEVNIGNIFMLNESEIQYHLDLLINTYLSSRTLAQLHSITLESLPKWSKEKILLFMEEKKSQDALAFIKNCIKKNEFTQTTLVMFKKSLWQQTTASYEVYILMLEAVLNDNPGGINFINISRVTFINQFLLYEKIYLPIGNSLMKKLQISSDTVVSNDLFISDMEDNPKSISIHERHINNLFQLVMSADKKAVKYALFMFSKMNLSKPDGSVLLRLFSLEGLSDITLIDKMLKVNLFSNIEGFILFLSKERLKLSKDTDGIEYSMNLKDADILLNIYGRKGLLFEIREQI